MVSKKSARPARSTTLTTEQKAEGPALARRANPQRETRRSAVRRATGSRGMVLPNAKLPTVPHVVCWDITVEEMGVNVQVVIDLLQALMQVVENAFGVAGRPFQHSALLAGEYAPQLAGLSMFHAQVEGGYTGKKSFANLTRDVYEKKAREIAVALTSTFTHLASLYAYLVKVTAEAWPGGYGQGNLSILNLDLLDYLMAVPAGVRTLRTQLDNWNTLRIAGAQLSQQTKRSGADILMDLHKGAGGNR